MAAGDLLGGSSRVHKEDDAGSGLGGSLGVVGRDGILVVF